MAENTLRDTLETAYDEMSADSSQDDGAAPVPDTAAETTPSPDSPAAEPAPSTEKAESRARDDAGKFTKPTDKGDKPVLEPKSTAPVKTAPAPVVPVAPAGPTIKPPQSWKPGAREEWAKIPPSVQAEIARVDRETIKAIQENARLKSQVGQDPMVEMLRPYEGAIRAQGVEPKQYVSNVLAQAHVIFNGPPQTRATALADIIMNAGVPPELLDQALVARMTGRPGAQMQAPQGQQAPPNYRDPRVDQLFESIEHAKVQQAESTAAEFTEKHEFAADVAEDVANIIELWGKQGKTSISNDDLDRAYNLACQMNPDVAPLLEQRKAAEAAQKAMASTARARNAASSVRSQPTAAPATQSADRRSVLEQKYDELMNG